MELEMIEHSSSWWLLPLRVCEIYCQNDWHRSRILLPKCWTCVQHFIVECNINVSHHIQCALCARSALWPVPHIVC